MAGPDEEAARAIAEALEQADGPQILADTAVSLASASLYYSSAEGRPPRLADARVLVDALAGLIGGVQGQIPEDLERALRGILSQAQYAYVEATKSPGGGGTPEPDPTPPPPPPTSRLWVPGRP